MRPLLHRTEEWEIKSWIVGESMKNTKRMPSFRKI
jgi:hypothetical protein